MNAQDDKSTQTDQQKLADMEKALTQAEQKASSEDVDQQSPDKKESPTPPEPKVNKQSPEKTPSRPSGKQEQPVKSGTSALWAMSVVQLLLIFGLAAAGIWFYMQWQQKESAYQQQIMEQQQRLQSHITQSQSLLESTTEQQRALQNSVASLLEQVQRSDILSESLQQRLSELSGRRPSDWLLAEADYLLRMAGRKLWLEQDVRTSILLLQSADSRLADLADPSLLPVRALIAEDVQSLQQINPISLSSIALSISGLIPQVNNLPLDTVKLPEPSEPEEDLTVSESVADWRDNLRKVWRSLVDDFIRITARDAPVQPFMAAQQQWLVKEQLKHALSQAQSAALGGQEAVYQQALQRALAVIVEHFDMQAAAVDQFVAALQNLKQTDISKTYPQQFKSHQPLRDVLDQRMREAFGNEGLSL